MIESAAIQDTLKPKTIVRQDSIRQLQDSAYNTTKPLTDSIHSVKKNIIWPAVKTDDTDTITSCRRNVIADVNYADSTNIIFRIDQGLLQNFPFVFTAKNRALQEQSRAELVSHLRSGKELPSALFQSDWLLPFILLTVFIFGLIRVEISRFFKDILKFISFRGINESTSRDVGSLYQWQSTLFNLSAFINISIFSFLAVVWFNVIHTEGKQLTYCLLSFAITVSAVTIRHLICIIAGNVSEQQEIFREYLLEIYQAHRLISLFLLVISILILYTAIIPVNTLFYTGFAIVAFLYFYRITRLFLIFIKRHVSILYLILYLCALEILPVGIIIKYFTGLV
jgi:hypothetical protein